MAALRIDADAPGVAQALGMDLGPVRVGGGETVVRRDGVGVAAVDIEAQQLAQQ